MIWNICNSKQDCAAQHCVVSSWFKYQNCSNFYQSEWASEFVFCFRRNVISFLSDIPQDSHKRLSTFVENSKARAQKKNTVFVTTSCEYTRVDTTAIGKFRVQRRRIIPFTPSAGSASRWRRTHSTSKDSSPANNSIVLLPTAPYLRWKSKTLYSKKQIIIIYTKTMTTTTRTTTQAVDTLGPLKDSVRSFRSTDDSMRSYRSEASSNASSSKRSHTRLHGNLMRTQSHRDPMDIYEVMEILGEGSMGSVSRVRKRTDAVGGSARRAFVEKHSQRNDCCGMTWLSFLRLPSQKDDLFQEQSSTRSSTVTTASTTTIGSTTFTSSSSTAAAHPQSIYRKQSSLVTYKEKHKDNFYALKSIHLDRCSNKEYIEELKVCIAFCLFASDEQAKQSRLFVYFNMH